jgi:hypothetical protein
MDVHKLSEQLIDFAERLSAVADAAAGKGRTRESRQPSGSASVGLWLLLPAGGAALYAALRSQFFARQAKAALGEARDLTDDAKSRAADLPNELLNTVRGTSRPAPRTRSRTQARSGRSRSGTTRSRQAGKRSKTRRASTSG